jgi:uncharacterized glyoxalase superfamily protein PhnB
MSATVIPTLRYRDAKAAIEYLQNVLGFEAIVVIEGAGDVIEHAQLRHGTGMVMLGSATDSEYDRALGDGRDPVGCGAVYVVTDDVYGHADNARLYGANIVMEPEEQDYGGIVYTLRDHEGNVWSFGSYDPWVG